MNPHLLNTHCNHFGSAAQASKFRLAYCRELRSVTVTNRRRLRPKPGDPSVEIVARRSNGCGHVDVAEQGASVTQHLTRLVEMTDNIQRGRKPFVWIAAIGLADHTAIQSVRLAKISRRAGKTRRSFSRSAAALERTTSLSDAMHSDVVQLSGLGVATQVRVAVCTGGLEGDVEIASIGLQIPRLRRGQSFGIAGKGQAFRNGFGAHRTAQHAAPAPPGQAR